MKKLLSAIMTVVMAMCACFFALPQTAAKAEAASSIDFTLPLPTGKTYSVKALSKYSDGSAHESYLTKYVLGQTTTSQPNCVMDIGGVALGTRVGAIAAGRVITNKYFSAGGYAVVIKHSDGSYSYYGHLRYRSPMKVGTTVSKNALVGYVGKTGVATGPHLHFEWSGHDPYCEFKAKGYSLTLSEAAAKYPHSHGGSGTDNEGQTVTKYVKGTGGCLCLNYTASSRYCKTTMPEGAKVTVYPAKASGSWDYVKYNGQYGYAYRSYLSTTPPSSDGTYQGKVTGTGWCLTINSKPKAGYDIGYIPEGAVCTIHSGKNVGNWLYVTYNGITGYAYGKYIKAI